MRRVLTVLLVALFVAQMPCAMARGADTVVGTVEMLQQATNDYGCLTKEMELCDTVADAVRSACGTQIAIVNGGDFALNLEGGEVTWGDILAVFREDRVVAVAEITGAQLLELLEYGVSNAVVDMTTETLDVEESVFDGFPQISGFAFAYDPTAPVGERILYADLEDGTQIDGEMTLTLAATGHMLSGGFGYPELEHSGTGVTLAGALAQYFQDGVLGDPVMKRIQCIGLSDRFALSRPTIMVISAAAIMLCFSFGKIKQRGKKENEMF